jgi:hypothetical protein
MGKKRMHRRKRSYKGGSHAFVGQALNYNNFSTYPGVSVHGGNHYALNPWKNDLTTGISTSERDFSIFPNAYIRGGYVYNNNSKKKFYKTYKTRTNNHSRSRKRKLRGGGPLLSDVVTGSRVITNGVSNVYNTLAGYPASPSPLPYKNQLESHN